MSRAFCVRSNRSRSVGAMALAILGGCATANYDSPYSIVEPGTPSAARRELAVFIHDVDGEIPVAQRYGVPVQPGKHVVNVNFSSGSIEGSPAKHVRTVQLDAQPCVRYRIVARHTQLTHVEWEPVIYSERIGECAERFSIRP